jgi:hypothetical protein
MRASRCSSFWRSVSAASSLLSSSDCRAASVCCCSLRRFSCRARSAQRCELICSAQNFNGTLVGLNVITTVAPMCCRNNSRRSHIAHRRLWMLAPNGQLARASFRGAASVLKRAPSRQGDLPLPLGQHHPARAVGPYGNNVTLSPSPDHSQPRLVQLPQPVRSPIAERGWRGSTGILMTTCSERRVLMGGRAARDNARFNALKLQRD